MLHTLYRELCTIDYKSLTMHSIHYILYTIYYILYTTYYILYTIYKILYAICYRVRNYLRNFFVFIGDFFLFLCVCLV